MNDTASPSDASAAAKPAPRHHVWDDSWIGVFILMLIAAILGGMVSRLLPWGEGLWATPSGELSDKVTGLEKLINQLSNAQPSSSGEDLNAIRAKVAQLEDRVKAAEQLMAAARAPATGPLAELPPDASATAKLDAAVKQVLDLQGRLAALEIGAKMAASPGVVAGTGMGVAAASTEFQALKDGLTKASETVTALSTRLDEIQSKVAVAGSAEQMAAIRADLDKVTGRLQQVEQADVAGSARRAALGAAVSNLSRAANSGHAFAVELEAVQTLRPAEPALKNLMLHARLGVPVLATLQSSFAARADAAIKAEREAAAGDGLNRMLNGVTSMVTVRATGTPQGMDTDSILARAESRLKAGDLVAAVSEVQRIKGPAREAIAPWLNPALARVGLDAALNVLNLQVVEELRKTAAAAPAVAPATKP